PSLTPFPTRRSSDLTEDLRYVPGDLSRGRGIPTHLALKRLPQIRGIVFRPAFLAPHYGLVQVAEQLLPTGAVFGLMLAPPQVARSEEHTSELQSREN